MEGGSVFEAGGEQALRERDHRGGGVDGISSGEGGGEGREDGSWPSAEVEVGGAGGGGVVEMQTDVEGGGVGRAEAGIGRVSVGGFSGGRVGGVSWWM